MRSWVQPQVHCSVCGSHLLCHSGRSCNAVLTTLHLLAGSAASIGVASERSRYTCQQVRLAEQQERFWGRRAARSLCVTQAMAQHLASSWGIQATVFHDRLVPTALCITSSKAAANCASPGVTLA